MKQDLIFRLPPPDWSIIRNRIPSSLVSTAELAEVFHVHPQSIGNWLLRKKIPLPEMATKQRGNKNFYRIDKFRAAIENISQETVWQEWLTQRLPEHHFASIQQAQTFIHSCYDLLGLEKPIE